MRGAFLLMKSWRSCQTERPLPLLEVLARRRVLISFLLRGIGNQPGLYQKRCQNGTIWESHPAFGNSSSTGSCGSLLPLLKLRSRDISSLLSSSQHARHCPARVLESTPVSSSLGGGIATGWARSYKTETKAVSQPPLQNATRLAAQLFWIEPLRSTPRRVISICLSGSGQCVRLLNPNLSDVSHWLVALLGLQEALPSALTGQLESWQRPGTESDDPEAKWGFTKIGGP